MDPSIMKLLEEDEDETMHSGADVEAFTAALNRDIEGDSSTFQPSDSDSAAFGQGSNHTTSRFPPWQTSNLDENTNCQSQQGMKVSQQQEQHSSLMELNQHGSGSEIQQQQLDNVQELNHLPMQQKQSQDDSPQQQAKQKSIPMSQTRSMQDSETNTNVQEPERTEHLEPRLQKMSGHQPAIAAGQAINIMNRNKQVPFALLVPVIEPQLDKDKAMQFQRVYTQLKQNEISKDVFVRHMRSIVGDQVLKMAVYKLQGQAARISQSGPNHFPSQSHVSAQHMQMPPMRAKHVSDPQAFSHLRPKNLGSSSDQSQIPSSAAQNLTDASNLKMSNNAQTSREVERQSDSHGVQGNQMPSSSNFGTVKQEQDRSFPVQGLTKQQQQHLHFSQSSFPTYGGSTSTSYPYSGTNVNSSAQSLRQIPVHPRMGETQLGTTTQSMNTMSLPDFERQGSLSEPKRMQDGALSHLSNNSTMQHNSVHWQPSTNKEQKNGALSSMTYVKQEQIDQTNEQQQKSQLSTRQGLSSFPPAEQGNGIPGSLREESFDTPSSRTGFSTPARSITAQLELNSSLNSRIPHTTPPVGPGSNAKPTPKKPPSIGQKKPLEALGSSPPLPGKKQKVAGSFSDQSIEQLNDVTAVSGVNLREEEEQLFSGPKEDSQASEASRRVVQEEEERMFLQKIPLHKKLAEIMTKSGLKGISADVERCLSLCVEERMRGLLSNLVRLSKQRVDIEKPRHRTVITSDVGQQILIMNRKTREEWEQKQADVEKLQKINDSEGNFGVDGDKDKEDGRVKSIKMQANKEEDDKMRTTAANVAARAAVGGDDVLSKWQLMAEQARQKREGGPDVASGSQPAKDTGRKPVSTTSVRNAKDNQEAENRSLSTSVTTSAGVRKSGRNQFTVPQSRMARSISVKDVIAVLEREPQTSKTTLIYRLYEKMRTNAVAE
ncbi:hypothetical protein LguiB_019916 [Lonicera macranthoides]